MKGKEDAPAVLRAQLKAMKLALQLKRAVKSVVCTDGVRYQILGLECMVILSAGTLILFSSLTVTNVFRIITI